MECSPNGQQGFKAKLILSGLLQQKEWESDRLVDNKAQGWFNLIEKSGDNKSKEYTWHKGRNMRRAIF